MSRYIALICFHQFVPSELRRAHNDVAGFIIAIVGVIYAVLLAFIAVSTWENFNKAQDAAELEANMVDNLYVDSAGLPPKLAFCVCQHLREYVRLVIEKECPRNKRGERISKDGNRCSSLTEKSQNFAQRQAPQQSIQRSYTPLTICTGPDVIG